jgi:Spy/CpxP family protein refolding chaperone
MAQEKEAFNAPLPRRRRRWGRTVLLGALILACGMVVGAALTMHLRWPRLLRAAHPWERAPERIVSRMSGQLDLTQEQETQIQGILAKHHLAMEGIRTEVEPRVEAQMDSMRREVEGVLTPEQARRWTDRFEKMRRHWPPGGPRRRPGFPGRRGDRPPKP